MSMKSVVSFDDMLEEEDDHYDQNLNDFFGFEEVGLANSSQTTLPSNA